MSLVVVVVAGHPGVKVKGQGSKVKGQGSGRGSKGRGRGSVLVQKLKPTKLR